MTRAKTIQKLAAEVARTERCTGCGACALLDQSLDMALVDGYQRPQVNGQPSTGDVKLFKQVCPGIQVRSPFSSRQAHPILGPYEALWVAWASDAEIRHQGSSGGVLSALSLWRIEQFDGTTSAVAADECDAKRTVPRRVHTRNDVLNAAGSRYAPVSAVAEAGNLGENDIAIGKPCEAAALRALYGVGSDAPLILSFFCAGTPSQTATNDLIERLGGKPDDVKKLWYRGRGWPGRFTACLSSGQEISTDYDDSWGASLGPTVQWRCRLCADGMGESADLVAGDLWDTDERGYPVFDDAPGQSVLIARTIRGREAALAAQKAGYVHLEPVTPDKVLAAQPSQVQRRTHLIARLGATVAMGLPVTHFQGFNLIRGTARPVKKQFQEAAGTAGRLRVRGYDWAGGRIRSVIDCVKRIIGK